MTHAHSEDENELAAGKAMTSDTQRSETLAEVEARVMQDYRWGNLTPLGVANHLRRGGFRLEVAQAKANAPTPPKVGSGELDAAGVEAASRAFNTFGHNMSDTPPIAAAIRAYLALAAPVDHPEVVGVPAGYVVPRKRGNDALFIEDRSSAAAEADIHDLGYFAVYRSALQPSDSPALEAGVAELRDFAAWVETWVSNPVGAYSVSALDGLFGMTRDKLAALAAREASR